jgi:hypothetical protein
MTGQHNIPVCVFSVCVFGFFLKHIGIPHQKGGKSLIQQNQGTMISIANAAV